MIDLSNYFCPNPNCEDHGIRGKGNITTSTRYGKNKTHLLRCKTCNQRFSEILPPVKKYPVLDGEKVTIVGRLGNTHLDILPFFLSDF